MFDDYKIVCVTPAGRRRYLRVLARYILSSTLVDEYHLWINTNEKSDIEYIHQLADASHKVRIVMPPVQAPGQNLFLSIPQFFRNCVDDRTIYVRFDDDIVYLEPYFFEKLLDFRVSHPEYFLIFPNIINNAICTYIQATQRIIEADAHMFPWCMDQTAWHNPNFAEQVHRLFLRSIERGEIARWHFDSRELAFCWFSINCMSWLGRDFRDFKGIVSGNEEEFLTVLKPCQLGRLNCIYGQAIASHFAFYPQRPHLDSTDLLEAYVSVSETGFPIANSVAQSSDHNVWTDRLLRAVSTLLHAPESDLRSTEFLVTQIRRAGLAFDMDLPYGFDNQFVNAGFSGVWQVPLQFARALLCLSQYSISEVIECGTGSGWTTSILTAYLLRFNANFKVTTIDHTYKFKAYFAVKGILPIHYQFGQSATEIAAQTFDLAVLDGDQTYGICRSNYFALGAQAPLCMIHRINDKRLSESTLYEGGPPRLWRELRDRIQPPDQMAEFLDHSDGDRIMGIGLILRKGARLA